MQAESDHAQTVAAWWSRSVGDIDPDRQIAVFCQTFNAVWLRAKRTLGEATIMAIGDRALYEAAERNPLLTNFSLRPEGIRVAHNRGAANGLAPESLKPALCAALTRFLVVQGRLTADILTPALHAELNTFQPADHAQDRDSRPPRGDGQEGEA